MIESVSTLRQMMAESKFLEVQQQVEVLFSVKNDFSWKELVELYLESLLAQNKNLPIDLLVDLIEELLTVDVDRSINWLNKFPKKDIERNYYRISKIKMHIADKKGKTEELYQLINHFQVHLFETRKPNRPEYVLALISKYFQHDFDISLQSLGLSILLDDIKAAEEITKKLIRSCFELATPRKNEEKFSRILDVLQLNKTSSSIDVYKSLCLFFTQKIKIKSDYKRLAEIVIYFDEFKFQTIVLELLCHLDLKDISVTYANHIKENPKYDFVYFEKFFPKLKRFFHQQNNEQEGIINQPLLSSDDLKLISQDQKKSVDTVINFEGVEEESHFIHMLNFQDYSFNEYIEIATSFLQSQMPKVSLKASSLAQEKSSNTEEYLKSAYLKMMSLLLLQDYRAALDLSIEASGKAYKPDDLLSFMYVQAELLMKLNQKKNAKEILEKIQLIDSDYRLTNERLVKLNEI
jgi:hypothetical protein